MPTKRKTTAEPKQQAAPEKQPEPSSRADAVKKILENVEQKMSNGDVKASLADYIRLVQLQKEMAEEPKTAIKVEWVEEPESSEE